MLPIPDVEEPLPSGRGSFCFMATCTTVTSEVAVRWGLRGRRAEPQVALGTGCDAGPTTGRNERSTSFPRSKVRTTMTTQLCRRCRFHPVSPRIAEYCSWDCYEADDEEDERDEEGDHQAA
jgi:hypothetical protein